MVDAPDDRVQPSRHILDKPMKYIAIAVLLAIVIGAALQYFKHDGQPPAAERGSGWMQR
jgi:hypothetical protein